MVEAYRKQPTDEDKFVLKRRTARHEQFLS